MTDKSAAAIREFAEKWGYTLEGWIDPLTGQPGKVLQPAPDKCLSDLTALISEHYYPKEFVQWITRPEKVAVLWSKAVDRGLDELFNYWRENEQ